MSTFNIDDKVVVKEEIKQTFQSYGYLAGKQGFVVNNSGYIYVHLINAKDNKYAEKIRYKDGYILGWAFNEDELELLPPYSWRKL